MAIECSAAIKRSGGHEAPNLASNLGFTPPVKDFALFGGRRFEERIRSHPEQRVCGYFARWKASVNAL